MIRGKVALKEGKAVWGIIEVNIPDRIAIVYKGKEKRIIPFENILYISTKMDEYDKAKVQQFLEKERNKN